MKYLMLFLCLVLGIDAFSQDTLRVMQYNLLSYGTTTSYCTSSNNNITDKDGYIKTIVFHVKPHIFTVCEMGANSYAIQRLLDSALNVNGVSWYKKANLQNLSGSNPMQMMYYDSRKLELHSQKAVATSVRDFNFYELYYKSPTLATTGDTAFLTCIVTHLKAGSTAADETTRAQMTQTLMAYMGNQPVGDYLLMGDFNVYRSTEVAYQNLVNDPNPAIRFYDPINQPGSWNSNSTFAAIHTQSTNSSSNGCLSGGGLDDRFDFILASQSVLAGTQHYRYVPGSYFALGNDGQHYNKAITATPANTSVPANVLNALFKNSDHLPVILKLVVDQQGASVKNNNTLPFTITYENPSSENINLYVSGLTSDFLTISLLSPDGKLINKQNVQFIAPLMSFNFSIENLSSGIYFIQVKNSSGLGLTQKLIVR